MMHKKNVFWLSIRDKKNLMIMWFGFSYFSHSKELLLVRFPCYLGNSIKYRKILILSMVNFPVCLFCSLSAIFCVGKVKKKRKTMKVFTSGPFLRSSARVFYRFYVRKYVWNWFFVYLSSFSYILLTCFVLLKFLNFGWGYVFL